MNLPAALGLLRAEEENLSSFLRLVSKRHVLDSEVHELAPLLADWSDALRSRLAPFAERYGAAPAPPPAAPRLASAGGIPGTNLLLDLQSAVTLATQVQQLWIVVALAAQARSDRSLDALAETACAQTERQIAWCHTQIKLVGSQVLNIPPQNAERAAVLSAMQTGKNK